MIEIYTVALVLAAAFAAWSLLKKRRGRSGWKALVEEAAGRLSGRASPGAALDAPELRAEVDGRTINVKVGVAGRAVATTKLEEGAEKLRIFIGWDVDSVPEGLGHFPEIALPVAYTFAGTMTTRANERETAERFLERAARELIDLRHGTNARALALTVRGGHIEVALAGMDESAAVIEQLARATSSLASRLRLEERSAPALPAERRCAACVDSGGVDWVACARCKAAYHRACFLQAGGCVLPGCGETQSVGLA